MKRLCLSATPSPLTRSCRFAPVFDLSPQCGERLRKISASILLRQRAAALGRGRIGLVAGHHGELLVVIPWLLGFRRLLDLEQIEVLHHAAIGEHLAALGEGVIDRKFLQLLRDSFRSLVPAALTAFR